MKFWDSSAPLPLVVAEPRTPEVLPIRRLDPELAIWWGSEIECRTAIVRKHREGVFDHASLGLVLQDLDRLLRTCSEVLPSTEIKVIAGRMVDRHPLRAADALQLAAATLWREQWQRPLDFVCFDVRLRDAARLDGFGVLPVQV